MTGRVTFRVMVNNPKDGKMISATRDYVQRASAFKRARRIADANPGRIVNVWEYVGPGNSHIHRVHPGETS